MILLWHKRLKVVYAVLAVLALSAGACRAESGIWETAVPSSSFILRAVWGHSPQGVFAVGDAGMILHFDGSGWGTLASGTDRDLLAVWGSGPSRVFAAGREGTLLFYDGSRWRGQDGGTGEDLHAVWGGGGPLVFAVGSSGVIRRFDGAAWRPMAGGVDSTLYGLWGNSAANVIAVGGGGLILNYDGSAWRPMKSPTGMVLRAVWGASRSDVFAAGSGLLLRYNGRDWRDESDGLRFITCLWGTSGRDVYSGGAASDGEGGFVRRFDGSGWQDEHIDAEAPIHGLWGDGRGNVFAVGGSRDMGGVIYRFDGQNWQEAWRQPEESLNQGLRGLWAGPDGHAVAVGDGGRVIRYDGASWSALDSGAPADYRGVWGAEGRLFVVGENGVVRHFDGSRWEDFSHDGLNQRLNAVWGYPDPDDPGEVRLVAVGDKGTILFYRGGTWEAAPSGTTADLKDVFGTSGSDITVVGTAGTLLHFDGSRWHAMESPTTGNLWGVWGAGPTDLFAVGDSNTILHFDGWLWRKMGDDPEKSDQFKCVWGRSGRDVYAAGDDGTLQHYDGAGWRRMAGGTEASIRKIGGTPDGVLFAVDSDGGVTRAEALTLSLPSFVDEGAGPQAAQGVAAIPSPRPEDLRVYLVSGSPSDIGVPATVTIPAGQVSAGFDAAVLDNAMADGTRSVRVMAEAAGFAPGVIAMDVTDDETASLFLDIPGEVFEGVDLAGRGLVRMSVPAVRDVTVFLASDNPAAVRVPPSVVIPAGTDRAVFDIRITDDTVIDEVDKAGVTARVTGWTGGSAAMDVHDDDRYGLTLTLAPVAREGDGPLPGAGKVAVPVPFPEDVVVTLTSDDTGEAVVPGTVTLPAGETAAVFDIFPVRDDLLDDAQPVLITATSPGFRGDEETITVLDGDAFWSFARRGSDVLRAVWGTAGGNAYAVGTYGTVLHHDGAAWRYMDTPVSGTLYDVWGASENDIFAVGGDVDRGGIVLHFDGTAWQKMIEGGFESISGVWGTSGGNVYAVGGSSAAGGMILHYDGREWRQVMRHEQVLEHVWGVSENDVFAVGAKGTILHYDGAAWRVMESGTGERLHGIWGTSGSHVYAAGNGGVILHYDGAAWRPMESGVTDHLYGLWGCSETDIYAVGRQGLVLRYDATGWQPMESGSEKSLWGVWGACPEKGAGASSVFAVGSEGLILRLDGAEWQPSKPVDVDLNDVWGGKIESESGAHAFAVGSLGTILRHDGTDWALVETGFHPDLNGVWGYAADRMVAVGDVGTILQYDGHRWRRLPSGTYANLNDISGCLTDEGLKLVAVGDDGTILTFDGAHWLAMDSGTTEDLFGVWITPLPKEDGGDSRAWEGFAVGWDGLVLHWDGRKWQPMESGTTRILYGIWGTSPSDLYAVGHLGTLLHYDGTAWQSIDVGSRLTLRGVWGRSERDVFVVGASGAVFHFDGVQWIRMEAPTGSYEKVWGAGRSVFVVGRYNFIIHYADVGIRLPEQATEEDGLLVGRGEVFLESASAADRAVTLRSHDPDEIAVPPVVTIPAGALSTVFDLTVLDDVLLDGTRRVAVTAATPGSSIGTAFVSVTDNEAAVLTLSLPDTVTEGEKPAAGSCRVDVDRPVERDVAVPLTSGDPAKLRVPAAVTIPFGETGAAFDLTAVDDRIFDGDRAVEIAAHVPGWTGDRRPVTVLDNEVTVLTLTLPETVSENAGLLAGGGSVAIPGIWPQDLTVALASDPPGHLILPAAVTLPAGRMEADFDIAAADDAVINGDRAVTVTAEADAWTAASRAITVVDNDPGTLRFATDRFMAWEAAGTAAVSVIREESTSGRITVDVETLDGSATAGEDYSRVAMTLVFADGESQKTFEIPVSADGWTEGVESIRLILDNPGQGAALGTPDTAEVMLVEAVSWQDDAGYQTESHLKGLWGADARNLFAVGWRGTILRFDGGAWHDMSLDTGETLHLEAVWGSRATDVFAVGGDGLILHYDGDKAFTVQESGTESDLYGVWGTSPRRVFAVGTGVILGYDGAEWREMTVSDGPVPDLQGIWGAGENDVFAVGYDGVILRFDGAAWRRMESGTTAHLYGVWGSGATDVFAVGAFGTILHYDGAGWRTMENGADRPVLFLDGVWGSSADDVFAVGYDGVILHYDGSRWQAMDAPGGGNALGAVWGPPGAGAGLDVFAVGEAGRMLHYAPLPAP